MLFVLSCCSGFPSHLQTEAHTDMATACWPTTSAAAAAAQSRPLHTAWYQRCRFRWGARGQLLPCGLATPQVFAGRWASARSSAMRSAHFPEAVPRSGGAQRPTSQRAGLRSPPARPPRRHPRSPCAHSRARTAFRCGWQHEAKSWQAWDLVKEFNLSYHNKETIVFTADPDYGTLTRTQKLWFDLCPHVLGRQQP